MPVLERNQHFLRTALALAHASNAAYLDDPLTDRGFAQMQWDEVISFDYKLTDTQGVVAVDAKNIVVSFRGTERQAIRDWLTNFEYAYYDKKIGQGHVHKGFATA